MIGPSGVGKTTTAAKLAARARIDGRTVMLRGLRPVARRRGRPAGRLRGADAAELATARTADELSSVLEESRGGPRHRRHLRPASGARRRGDRPRQGEQGLPGDGPRAPRAALRAARPSARSTRRAWPSGSGRSRPTSLAITKIDETDAPAGLLHASWAAKLPISVVCFGQRVPEDIAPATSGALLDYLAPKRDEGRRRHEPRHGRSKQKSARRERSIEAPTRSFCRWCAAPRCASRAACPRPSRSRTSSATGGWA